VRVEGHCWAGDGGEGRRRRRRLAVANRDGRPDGGDWDGHAEGRGARFGVGRRLLLRSQLRSCLVAGRAGSPSLCCGRRCVFVKAPGPASSSGLLRSSPGDAWLGMATSSVCGLRSKTPVARAAPDGAPHRRLLLGLAGRCRLARAVGSVAIWRRILRQTNGRESGVSGHPVEQRCSLGDGKVSCWPSRRSLLDVETPASWFPSGRS
jgi:hypothetical protein